MSKESAQPAEYWMHDDFIGEISVHSQAFSVRARHHISSERYYDRKEIVPVAENGIRFYLHARPYILLPEVNITIGVFDQPKGSQIGKVTDSQWRGMRHQDVGNAQAWYYPADRTIVLWECYLFDPYRTSQDPIEDGGLKSVWEGLERLLSKRHPSAVRIATPCREPIYEQGTPWQDFLRQQGYEQASGHAFVKKVPLEGH